MHTELVEFLFKKGHKTFLTLYKNESYDGYDMKELEKKMPKALWKKFAEWSNGQTCGFDPENQRVICYSWDLDAFLNGQAPLD